MDLFILRHGKAEKSSDGTSDAARRLTRDGKEEVKKVAQWMKNKKIRFNVIATSPLKRARGTAKIVAKVLDQKERLFVWDDLAPGGDLDSVCYQVSGLGSHASILVVGHEPGVSMLISKITGKKCVGSPGLAKAGLAKIQNYAFAKRPSGDLQWLLTPGDMKKRR